MEKGDEEGRGDWKINGVCDWQPMILGIRLNWIRERESAGHNPPDCLGYVNSEYPRAFFFISITGLQGFVTKYFIPSGGSQPKRVSNPNQLRHLNVASWFVPTPRSLYLPRINWQLIDRMWNGKFLSLDFVRKESNLIWHRRHAFEGVDRWVNKTNHWMNRKPEYVAT